MGYFNIFYKLTRIIDFFTRKRNRKFVLALCLIGGIVFFSPNVVNAQYTNFDSQQLVAIRNDLDSINNGVDIHLSVLYGSVLNQEYDIDAIRTYVTSILSTLGTMSSNLITVKNTLNTIETDVDDLETQINDLLTYANSIEIKIDTIMNTLNNIDNNIEHYGDLNHDDLEEIKELLKDYLYGDADLFPYGFKQVNGIVARNGAFELNSDYNTIYFEAKENEYYYVQFSKVTINPAPYMIRYGYVDSIPGVSTNYIDYNTWTQPYNDYLELVGNGTGKYIYISYAKGSLSNFLIESTYNQGQEMGIYGGLTNIEQTTIYQGEQTRDTIQEESEATRNTITDTTYNQSDVNVNTSAIDSVSSSEIQGLFTTIFNNFNSAITGGTDSIVVPLPHGRSINFV